MKRSWLTGVVAAVAAVLLTPLASAQAGPDLGDLIDKLAASLRDQEGVFQRSDERLTVEGVFDIQRVQETYRRDARHFRMEDSEGSVTVWTPEEISIYHGPSNTLLHIPPETFDYVQLRQGAGIRNIGVVLGWALDSVLLRARDGLEIVGEREVGGADCWVLLAEAQFIEHLQGTLDVLIPQLSITLTNMEFTLEKDTGYLRGIEGELGVEVPNVPNVTAKFSSTVTEIDRDIDVPDDMLTFERPPTARLVEWAPGKTLEQVGRELLQGGGGL